MPTKLTEFYLKSKTRIDRLSDIQKFNACACDLRDVSLLESCPSLSVCSLAVNFISSLKPFSGLSHLRDLSLRQNLVKGLDQQVKYLSQMTSLRRLWLADNPIAKEDGYRERVILSMPDLEVLDDVPITSDERDRSRRVQYAERATEAKRTPEDRHTPPDDKTLEAFQRKVSPKFRRPVRSPIPCRIDHDDGLVEDRNRRSFIPTGLEDDSGEDEAIVMPGVQRLNAVLRHLSHLSVDDLKIVQEAVKVQLRRVSNGGALPKPPPPLSPASSHHVGPSRMGRKPHRDDEPIAFSPSRDYTFFEEEPMRDDSPPFDGEYDHDHREGRTKRHRRLSRGPDRPVVGF
eukprot:TRINITY_DN678_c4_g1_i1.p1 TRINITY_DN678_c4_g1~~TRINITY_DN678_c4_g1_i1.p1  ORF type:complete len:344 (-),score=83.05 TRINITY_DN678_c4_g1_i1:595-1626(-)